MAGKRPPMGRATKGKGKPVVPPPRGTVKGKPVVPPAAGAPTGRRMGPPPPVRPRLTPTRAPLVPETPRMERLEAPPEPPRAERMEERASSRAPIMQQRGAPATMARLRRGQVAF